MRRGTMIVVVLLAVLGAIAIGVGAYNVGLSEGLEQSGRAGEVVRVIRPGFGHFPFGLILFPLLFIGLFVLLRGAFWGPRWGGGGAGPWGPDHFMRDRSEMFDEWHRRQHEPGAGDRPAASGEPAGA